MGLSELCDLRQMSILSGSQLIKIKMVTEKSPHRKASLKLAQDVNEYLLKSEEFRVRNNLRLDFPENVVKGLELGMNWKLDHTELYL
jgi:hypothetical protein